MKFFKIYLNFILVTIALPSLSQNLSSQSPTDVPYPSCMQTTIVPTYTFAGNATYTLTASPGMEEKVFLSCPNTIVYDTLYGAGRHAIINAFCNYKTKFGSNAQNYLCFVKNTGTLTILTNTLFVVVDVFYEPNAVIINQSTATVNTHSCSNISIPSFNNCNDVSAASYSKDDEVILLYPNPASNELTISFNLDIEESYKTISIYNTLGQLVREEDIEFKNNKLVVETNEFDNGVYLFTLKDKTNFLVSKRFVIAR